MVANCLCLVFVLLCLGQLVQSQFGSHDATCKKICQVWEGDRYAQNTICHKRYKKCVEQYFVNYFEDKGNIVLNAITRFFTYPEPCKLVKQGIEIEGTLCRDECTPLEEQLEFVPHDACGPDLFCCKEKIARKQICGRIYDDIYELPYLNGSGPKCMYNCMLKQTGMLRDNGLFDVESTMNLKSDQIQVLKGVARECRNHRHLSGNQCETVGLFMECTSRELTRRNWHYLSMADAIVKTYKSL